MYHDQLVLVVSWLWKHVRNQRWGQKNPLVTPGFRSLSKVSFFSKAEGLSLTWLGRQGDGGRPGCRQCPGRLQELTNLSSEPRQLHWNGERFWVAERAPNPRRSQWIEKFNEDMWGATKMFMFLRQYWSILSNNLLAWIPTWYQYHQTSWSTYINNARFPFSHNSPYAPPLYGEPSLRVSVNHFHCQHAWSGQLWKRWTPRVCRYPLLSLMRNHMDIDIGDIGNSKTWRFQLGMIPTDSKLSGRCHLLPSFFAWPEDSRWLLPTFWTMEDHRWWHCSPKIQHRKIMLIAKTHHGGSGSQWNPKLSSFRPDRKKNMGPSPRYYGSLGV